MLQRADAERTLRLQNLPARKRKHKRRGSKGNKQSRDRDVVESSSDISDEDDIFGVDDHVFRRVAREVPGRIFSDFVADTRTSVGATMQCEPGSSLALFQKWHDHCFKAETAGKGNPKLLEEISLFVRLLDELLQGRAIEVADIISSRLKYLAISLKTDNWTVAAEFQAYRPREHSFVSDESLRVAARMAKQSAQLRSDLKTLSGKAPGTPTC